MKVSGPILPPPSPPAPSGAGAAKGQARGQFQNMIQRLESDMWAGADAGASAVAPAPPRAPVRGGGPVAAPAKLTPASTLRDPSLPAETETPAPKRYDIRDIVAAQAPLAAPVASERARPGEPLAAFAPMQAPRARA
ncbi:hypothetical protein J7J50_15850, partial [Lysobacter sp. ISL-50]|nr:hypothetical protein [Lysobacter sp. ISL-50]